MLQVVPDRHKITAHKLNIKIGKWKVRRLFKAGQPNNMIQEMRGAKLDIFGLYETHWIDNGRLNLDNHILLHSSGNQHRKGVGIIMTKKVSKSLLGCWTISDVGRLYISAGRHELKGEHVNCATACKRLCYTLQNTTRSSLSDREHAFGLVVRTPTVEFCIAGSSRSKSYVYNTA